MFDGNFRSSRREVNLSGTRDRNKNRKDLLKNAEQQRKQRQEQQRREKAARLIQRSVRGYLSKLQTVEWCLQEASQHGNISALSMCLSFHPYLTKFNTTRRDLLLQFQQYDERMTANDDKVEEMSIEGVLESDNAMPLQPTFSSSQWFSHKRMTDSVLQELDPKENGSQQQQNGLYNLLTRYWETTRIDDNIFLTLALCLQKWCIEDPENDITKTLTDWSIQASDKLPNHYSKAILATIILGSKVQISTMDDFTTWYTPLAEILHQVDDTNRTLTNTSSNDFLLKATLTNLSHGREYRLLSNLLDRTKSSQLVLLIHFVLTQTQNEKLKLAVSLIARGDRIDQSSILSANTNNEWDDYDESDEDDEDTGADTIQNTSSAAIMSSSEPSCTKKPRATTQYRRQDLLTLVKLDKLYQERIQQESNKLVFDTTTINVATKIVQAPWVQWGLEVLGRKDDNNAGAEKQFIQTLGILLQASSTLRPKTKLSPMSPVAFNKTILESFWKIVQKQPDSDLARTIFSDLFSHYLVALSDQDFVRLHCNTTEQQHDDANKILAKDLVEYYGNVLYEVYWTKPVVAYEISMDNPRGRLILSGTKLWNSLYERWNRLVKNSFCGENAWWFPYLSTREGDRAVVPAREREHTNSMDDESSDDSSDDDDDQMDTDDGNQNQLSAAEVETDALADSFRDPKMARVLTSIPQSLPFERRVILFHSLLQADKQKALQAAASRRALMAMGGQMDDDEMMWFMGGAREQIKIRRAALYGDSMEQLNSLGSRLKHKIQVTFVNQHGTEEAGIDGGGVFKEFVDDLIKDGFAARPDGENHGGAPQLFSITPDGLLSVNLDLTDDSKMLRHYSFLGRVLAKAVYENILVEPQFCLPFLNQLLGKVNTLEDLKNYDEEYYINLNKIRHYNDAEIDSLGLTFELTVGGNSPSSRPRTVDLVRNGRSITVTKKNVFQYTHAVANQLLNIQGAKQTRAFLHGFRDLIPVSWVRLFSAKELQKLISGDDSIRGIDVTSLKRAMHYLGGYHESQPYIQAFWDILEKDFQPEQQRKFLRFMTSCSRQPLLGFASLEPVPSIQQIRLRDDERTKNSRLPTSQTCMNLLKLPNYQDRQLLKEKLLAAVEAGAGFELT